MEIADYIENSIPSAFGKIGGTEGKALTFVNRPVWSLFKSKRYRRYRDQLYYKSGVYPPENEIFRRFLKYFSMEVLPNVDGLAVWRGQNDLRAMKRFAPSAFQIDPEVLGVGGLNWSDALFRKLQLKRILVVSSLSHTIDYQKKYLDKVWPCNPSMYHLENTVTMRCPMYAHLEDPVDEDWFIALDRMKASLSEKPFDVCLIAAGAWSLPLAVECKKIGKIGIHLGGSLQLAYGILGNRWMGEEKTMLKGIANDHWVFPFDEDTPKSFSNTEDAAYWKA